MALPVYFTTDEKHLIEECLGYCHVDGFMDNEQSVTWDTVLKKLTILSEAPPCCE
jgi:hypothetical protein